MTQRTTRIIVITAPDQLDQEWINKLAREPHMTLVERVGLVHVGIELAQQTRPDVVIVDRAIDQVETAIRQISTMLPDTICIGVVDRADLQIMRRLVTVGARDIIARPLVYSDLTATIQQAIAAEVNRRSNAGSTGDGAPIRGRGKLIVAIAPKGGVGTTTIATNLAVALRQISHSRVIIADFGLQFGDVGVLMNILARNTMQALFSRSEDIDDTMLAGVIQQHESGLHVLLAPNTPDAVGELDRHTLTILLDRLLERYSYVICDTWSFLDEITETLLSKADEVLVVTTPEVPALKNTRSFLEYIESNKLIHGRITLILNRFPSVNGISLQDVQKHLRHDVSANIPSEGTFVTHSINRGIPVVISHPRSWVAQNLLKLAAYVTGDDISAIALDHPSAGQARGNRLERVPGGRGFLRIIRGESS